MAEQSSPIAPTPAPLPPPPTEPSPAPIPVTPPPHAAPIPPQPAPAPPGQPTIIDWDGKTQLESINEGTSYSFSGTTQLPPGTTLWWSIFGQGLDPTDTENGGSIAVGQNGDFSIGVFVRNDSNLDGKEYIGVRIYTDKERQVQVGESNQILINDTSRPVRVGDVIYGFVRGLSWSAAEAEAVALGGELAKIENQEKNALLVSLYPQLAPDSFNILDSYWYIGLSRDSGSGEWRWRDGSPATYFNWDDNQPSQASDFAQIDARRGVWYTDASNVFSLGLYEKEAPGNTLPKDSPILEGIAQVGSTIRLSTVDAQDPDNPADYSPFFDFSWEISQDKGSTWTTLENIDATDNDEFYTPRVGEDGLLLRGIASYLDGNLFKEEIASVPAQVLSTNTTDTIPPIISELTISTNQVNLDAGEKVTVSVRLSDPGSGIIYDPAGLPGNMNTAQIKWTNPVSDGQIWSALKRISGDDRDGIYEAEVDLTNADPLWYEQGVKLLPQLVVADLNGNKKTFTNSILEEMGYDASLEFYRADANQVSPDSSGTVGGDKSSPLNPAIANPIVSVPATAGVDPIPESQPSISPPPPAPPSSSPILGIEPQETVKTVGLPTPLVIGSLKIDQVVVGTVAHDLITGSDTGEALAGGQGKDKMTGGGGSDAFVFETPGEFGKKKADAITDFRPEEGDKIAIAKETFSEVSRIKLDTATGKQETRTAASTNKNFIYDDKSGILYFNENGRKAGFGNGGEFAQLLGAPDISKGDLVLL